ncbi:hypothetical protein [Thermoflexus sp.]|uniref:hypothetical protein n=1 Tax=Thermoflexus sp. TaxID=1969742 RepID=UPI002ADD73F3|nr:hypothetical protein [Thermoflexus sp.]
MATWAVVHLIHVRVPHEHIPVLVIRDVPEGERITVGLLERAGFRYGEFGSPWANHYITRVNEDSPSDLIARIRMGEGRRISYEELVRRASAPL